MDKNNGTSSASELAEPGDAQRHKEDIYRQVEDSKNPYSILGVTSKPYLEVRAAYRALVLLLHSDKSLPHQTVLHQRLFIKVQESYENVFEHLTIGDEDEDEGVEGQPIALTPEERIIAAKELRARIWDAREWLREGREKALAAKKLRKEGRIKV